MKTRLMTMAVSAFLSLAIISAATAFAGEQKDAKAGTNIDIWETKDWDKDLTDCGKPVCKKEFVHYVKTSVAHARAPTCYKLMGPKWKTFPITYYVNPQNGNGMGESEVLGAFSAASGEWDRYTSKALFSTPVKDYSAAGGTGTYNNKNEISWGDYPESLVIAVTTTWYNPYLRQILEFDILMDTDFTWATTGDPSKMDVQNIATHELGHGIGLSDIYDTACSAVTMYGYSYAGDLEKRTLAQPDITGLQKIYGK